MKATTPGRRRPFLRDRPVYTIGIAQPRIPWAGNDSDAEYARTLYRPQEKAYYAHKVSQQKEKMPAVMDHAGQTQPGHVLPAEAMIGDSLGAMHDNVGNLFQICVLNPARSEAPKIWDDLEAGVPIGLSLWHDIVREVATNKIVDIKPRHIGVTYDPAWGRVSFEDGPPEYDKGSYIRHWTQDPRELQRIIAEEYGQQPLMLVPPSLTERIATIVAEAPPHFEPSPAQSSFSIDAVQASASPPQAAEPRDAKKWYSSEWAQSLHMSAPPPSDAAPPQSASTPPVVTPITPPPAPSATPTEPLLLPPKVTLDDIKARAKDINADRKPESRLTKVTQAMHDLQGLFVGLPAQNIAEASRMLQELAAEYEALQAPVDPELSELFNNGQISQAAAEYARMALNNRTHDDARYVSELVLATSKNAESQRAAEKALLAESLKKTEAMTTLKRERDASVEEEQKAKKRCIELEALLKNVGPQTMATTPASSPPPAEKPLTTTTTTEALQATAKRIGPGGQAGSADYMRALFAKQVAAERMGQMRWSTQSKPAEMAPTQRLGRDDIEWNSRVTITPDEQQAIHKRIEAAMASRIRT